MSTGPSLKEKLIKIGAKVISHGRSIAFQMAEVVIPRQMLQEIAADRRAAAEAAAGASLTRPMVMRSTALTGGLRPDAEGKQTVPAQERCSGAGWRATRHQPGRDFRKAQKIATVPPKFSVHQGNPG